MAKKMILLFSHTLSEKQREDAKKSYGVSEFIYLKRELQQIWSNISEDVENISGLLKDIKNFIKVTAKKDDIVLIQGDFGAVYEMINFSKELGLITVYATTKRVASENINENGQSIKKSLFEHRRFREYGK